MKSPFTGKEMKLMKEKRSMEFRKETFDIIFHYYLCEDSNEQFTAIDLDEININQLYNQYRDRYNIPFPEEIKNIRTKYELSLNKMSQLLGFGINVYRHYENGDMPSLSNAKLIQMAAEPKGFVRLVEMCDTLVDGEKEKLIKKIKAIIEKEEEHAFDHDYINYLTGSSFADALSGYRKPSFEKFYNMVLYFSEKLEPFKTKLNKLLFYSDFLMFKKSCRSISGIRYLAIQRGPVPNNFQSMYEYLANKSLVEFKTVDFGDYYGEKIKNVASYNRDLFEPKELEILAFVAAKFSGTNATEISDISHEESAWIINHENKSMIDYHLAFDLKINNLA